MSNKSVSDFVAAAMDAVLKSEAHKSLFGTQYKFASDKCSKCGSESCKCGDSGMADDNSDDDKKPGSVSGTGVGSDPYRFTPDPVKDQIKAKPPASGDKAKADDSFAWDDNDARKKKKDSDEDTASAWDDNDARKKKKDSDEDTASAWDDNDARKKKKDSDDEEEKDTSDADDDLDSAAAFDVAIDSLLTASAALDAVGMEKSAAFSLKLASLVVEAKKKDKDKDKNDADKEKAKKAKEKEKAAKEKEKEKLAKEKAKEKAKSDKAKADAQAAKDKESKKKAEEKKKADEKKKKEQASKSSK